METVEEGFKQRKHMSSVRESGKIMSPAGLRQTRSQGREWGAEGNQHSRYIWKNLHFVLSAQDPSRIYFQNTDLVQTFKKWKSKKMI